MPVATRRMPCRAGRAALAAGRKPVQRGGAAAFGRVSKAADPGDRAARCGGSVEPEDSYQRRPGASREAGAGLLEAVESQPGTMAAEHITEGLCDRHSPSRDCGRGRAGRGSGACPTVAPPEPAAAPGGGAGVGAVAGGRLAGALLAVPRRRLVPGRLGRHPGTCRGVHHRHGCRAADNGKRAQALRTGLRPDRQPPHPRPMGHRGLQGKGGDGLHGPLCERGRSRRPIAVAHS